MPISQGQVQSAVVISMVGSAGVIVVSRASQGKTPEPRMLIAVGFIYLVVAGTAEFAPEIGLPLAVMVFVAITLSVGGDALAGINRAVRNKSLKAVNPKTQVAPSFPGAADALIGSTIPSPTKPVGPNAPFVGNLKRIPIAYTGGTVEYVDESIYATVVGICEKFGVRVSDGYSQSKTHKERSDHKCGLAVDFVGQWPNMDRLGKWAYTQGFPWVGWQVPDHYNHVHISFRRCNWNAKEG